MPIALVLLSSTLNVLLASGLNTLLPRLWEHRKDQKKKKKSINANLEEMKRLSTRLLGAIDDPKFRGDGSKTASDFKKDARIVSQKALDSVRIFYSGKNMSNTEFEEKTKRHCANMKDLSERLEKYAPQEKATKKPEDPCATDHMAMDETVQEVLKLIELPGRQEDGGLKVISIVGFPGLGKTIIAKLVYVAAAAKDAAGEVKKHTLVSTFWAWWFTPAPAPAPKDADGELASHAASTIRARVTAGAKDASQVLRDILKEVDAHPHGEHGTLGLEKPSLEKLSGEKLGKLLTQRLRGKRYFIVIDDIQSIQQWANMKDVFPKNGDDVSGTIIVTTSIQSVANVCSPWKGYVYNLSALDYQKSVDLFIKDRTSWTHDSVENNASDILEICDGLPLAIVSMSDMLKGTAMGVQTSDSCRSVRAILGTHLLNGLGGLERLQWVLMNKYTGLTCDALRSCLLYYCLYQHNMDAVPRMNSLVRRWEAEGFLVGKPKGSTPRDVTEQNLETLMDRNIMQSMEVGKNGRTRRCRPPGMMLEYISSISMWEEFAASVSDAVPSGIRRLSFYPASDRDVKGVSDEDLKLVLTLEVSGVGCEAILGFKKYELVAVLELKECTNLNSSHVKDICKLVLLKYLSLGNSIEEIPVAIKYLKLLETLEMRRDLPVLVHEELLELPNLKHLLGMFHLRKLSDKKLENFLSGKSGIETVTGFVTGTARGFPKLMHHMKRLRKVKIHCAPTATDEDQIDLQTKIKNFTRRGTNSTLRLSLSVDFTEFNPGIHQSRTSPLEFLQEAGSVDSLKLRGDWRPFISAARGQNNPGLQMMSGITKLCLSGTHLSGEVVLAGLTHFTALQFLKLEEEELGPLEIESGTFQVLTWLCLVGQTRLHGITIERAALPKLLSLHLICEALDPGLESSIRSGGVMALEEIAIDSQDASIKDAWKNAAEGHPNRPRVLLIKKGHRIRRA